MPFKAIARYRSCLLVNRRTKDGREITTAVCDAKDNSGIGSTSTRRAPGVVHDECSVNLITPKSDTNLLGGEEIWS